MSRILAVWLCVTGICTVTADVSYADSIFDRFKAGVSGFKDKATSAVKNVKKKASSISSKAQTAMKKVSDIAGKVQEAKGTITKVAGKVGISEKKLQKAFEIVDKTKEKVSEASQKLDEGVEKLGLQPEEEEKSEETKGEEKGDEAGEFPKEVIEKIDKLFTASDAFERLKSVSFEGQAITDEDMPYLAEKLSKLAADGLKKVAISFRGCNISLDSVLHLLDKLKSHPQFVGSLSLSGTALGDDGVASVASNLSNFPMLKYIFLSDMKISGDGAIAVISVLVKLSQNDGSNLQLIDLSNNAITDEHIETVVSSWTTVKDHKNALLMLHDNPIKNTVATNVPDNIKLKLK